MIIYLGVVAPFKLRCQLFLTLFNEMTLFLLVGFMLVLEWQGTHISD